MHDLALQLAIIGVAGIAAQWIAWRLQIPAIVLLLAVGLVFGPLTGFMNPRADFGDLYTPLVSTAVAIILFEGGLTLNFREIRETSRAVRRIVTVAGPLVWLMTALAAHYIGNLTWPTAIILGGLLVITGPTVIMPLLRHAKLKNRPASILRWEAIVNDPIGALFAVLAFEIYLVLHTGHQAENLAFTVLFALAIAVPGGIAAGRFLAWAFARGAAPEYLKAPILLAAVVGMNSLTNLVLEEGGLLTVTVMGITMANSRIASLADLRRFKETITILLVSGLFIILTASLQPVVIAGLEWRVLAFLFVVLFVIRPLAVFVATIGAGLTWRERALVGWIAPRGIVATAVAGLFGSTLADLGVVDGDRMIAYVFAIVAVTILLHGFTLGPLSRLLDLRSADRPGVLIVGASRFTIALARRLKAQDVPVLIADANWSRISQARLAELDVWYGEVLSEAAHHNLNLSRFDYLIAATDNEAYNALVCTDFGPEMGRSDVFQIGKIADSDRRAMNFTIGGQPLFQPAKGFVELRDLMVDGWNFQATRLTDEFEYQRFTETRAEGTHAMLWIRPSGALVFAAGEGSGTPSEGDTIISFGPRRAEREQEKIVKATTTERETRAEKARQTAEAVKPGEVAT
ncbi:cation:proton antiporter [Aurantimonas endophytica]|uniref:NhaP-type Na+/H+ or K+/H+ antiporter n=1 Tax=Aurantimonas endophytica TaxID=1522175 RepID=A0A7W6HBZ9_9HYPH|nr:sodium:proton antiporter [Aurantimonas endophytica]MBB4002277.1 NhaP-type Na+/H+ or K+/H+ antiporter [Aurantimonas endophytica]MCO6402099.1 sodium:proton antiporter [Aurantimonas endophytica]